MTEKDLDIAIEKCERIMEFDTRTMQNPVSENGHIFEKVYELLKFLRQLQFATDTNVGGNLIDRQAALEAMETWDKFGCDPDGKLVRYDDDKHYIPYVHYEDMVHAIKHLPSAQRTGRWIDKMLDHFRKYEVVCSECGARYIGNYDSYDEPYEFNYCPNCGADMRRNE